MNGQILEDTRTLKERPEEVWPGPRMKGHSRAELLEHSSFGAEKEAERFEVEKATRRVVRGHEPNLPNLSDTSLFHEEDMNAQELANHRRLKIDALLRNDPKLKLLAPHKRRALAANMRQLNFHWSTASDVIVTSTDPPKPKKKKEDPEQADKGPKVDHELSDTEPHVEQAPDKEKRAELPKQHILSEAQKIRINNARGELRKEMLERFGPQTEDRKRALA